ncbi:hypothetical protein NCCP436_23570 [Pseudomonas sp. NCCP-436]|nr:hypothetical protein NCCP436_23570 [Pseudomonas sp. NCCP-436]
MFVDAGGECTGAIGERRVLDAVLVEKILRQAHLAAASRGGTVWIAAAFGALALKLNRTTQGFKFLLIIAQYLQR